MPGSLRRLPRQYPAMAAPGRPVARSFLGDHEILTGKSRIRTHQM
jgi:hypothetical protein